MNTPSKTSCRPETRLLHLLAMWLLSATLLPGGQLAAADSQTAAPQAPARDFTVESPADGKRFTLSSARGKYVALHFLLKTECPFCLKHTRDYAMKSAATPDVVHVFLKPDDAEAIRSWAAKVAKVEGWKGVSIYRDPDAALARQFGIPDGYAFHGETVHYPALVLLDPSGREVFRHVGKSNAERYPQDKFTATLDELRRQAKR